MMMRRINCYSLSPRFMFYALNLFVYSVYTLPTAESGNALNVFDFGAKGDGSTDDTLAFQHAWKEACSSQSMAVIVVPDGEFMVRPISFTGPCKSWLTVEVDGTIVAPEDQHVWDGLDRLKWLYFENVTHLTVQGRGTINGMGQSWWAESCKIKETNALTFYKCNDLSIGGLLMLNSQQMHLSIISCVKVTVSHLRVLAPPTSPNTDGININASTSVTVKDTTIATGDDCISIVANSSWIRIRNIVCGPGHGISIGSLGKYNLWDSVHDVSVKGALLSNTTNGARIKTWQGGSGFARNITYENITMQNVSHPIIINQYYCDSAPSHPCANQTSAVAISDVSFIQIKGTSSTKEAIRMACSDTSPCTNILLKEVKLVPASRGSDGTSFFSWNAYGSTQGLVYPPVPL